MVTLYGKLIILMKKRNKYLSSANIKKQGRTAYYKTVLDATAVSYFLKHFMKTVSYFLKHFVIFASSSTKA